MVDLRGILALAAAFGAFAALLGIVLTVALADIRGELRRVRREIRSTRQAFRLSARRPAGPCALNKGLSPEHPAAPHLALPSKEEHQ